MLTWNGKYYTIGEGHKEFVADKIQDMDYYILTLAAVAYESRKMKGLPLEGICRTPMIPEWKLQLMANHIFRNYLMQRDKVLALANSMLEAHIGDTGETVDYEEIIEQKKRQLAKHNRKLDNYIEMRAEGDIDKDSFTQKTSELRAEIRKLSDEIEALEDKQNYEPEIVDYKEKLTVLQYALVQYTNPDENDIPESIIEAFVEKIVAKKDGFDWYLRFDGDPNDPLHLKTEGRRRQNSSVSTVGGHLPTTPFGDAGRYQRLIFYYQKIA